MMEQFLNLPYIEKNHQVNIENKDKAKYCTNKLPFLFRLFNTTLTL